jgi:hypothetical protein
MKENAKLSVMGDRHFGQTEEMVYKYSRLV